uniref:C2H2-type domain-containing protein n=1 Tax=Glossina morsitans morsitans TaxID=37546 RepID=A0A1B0GBP0_GLOMM
MSSQTSGGNNNNASGVVSGGGVNNAPPGQSGSGSANSVKSNSKMSIDHQATLDKGLKMKIKRTKTGTKTSEAKHEIVKATEQQNGILAANSGCNANLDENTAGNSSNTSNCGPNASSNNSGTNLQAGISSNSNGNKKHVGSNNSNQSNSHNSSNNTSMMSSGGGANISNSSQGTPQGTKRGSSGHRRDKTKEKNAHSNRVNVDKSTSQTNEKETGEKLTCQCNGDIIGANATVPCSNNLCIRRNESNKLPERMANSNSNTISNASVPPGVFTPTVDNLNASGTSASAANILTATTTVSSATIAQASSNSGGTNAPGPPNKDNSSTANGNMKVSPHIAAQLAAAAVSNTFSSNTSNSGGTNISNTNSISSDLKTSSSSLASGTGNSVQVAKHMAPGIISATMHHTISVPVTSHSSTIQHGTTPSGSPPKLNCGNSATNLNADETSRSPPAKRTKHSAGEMNTVKEMVDICVGTSVGTITEPDCLGPCEPGTSVTLEGIVWHETEGGVLVVNVTWRGKTYVGTLLDCTRHDWAPPRFCDSPTEELDSRTPKGRGKRGRSAAITPDLSNFTETRSSIYFSHAQVHSKLRNGSTKGGRAAARTSTTTTTSGSNSIVNTSNNTGSMPPGNGNGGTTPSTSPTAFLPPRPEKRKSKDEPPSPVNGENETLSLNMVNASGIPISASGGGLATQPQSLLNPVTGLNVQINTKKYKTASPCAISPVLLECPEQDCSKKYKHANGLRYHQSHAHGGVASMDEDSLQLPEIEEPPSTPSPGPIAAPPPAITPNSSDIPGTVASANNNSNVTAPHSSTQESSTVTTFGNSTANSSSESTVCTSRSISNMPQTTPSASLLVTASAQGHEQISGVPSAGGSITAGTSNQALTQQKQQLVELATVTSATVSNVTPLEQNQQTMLQHGPPAKSGVLRFGQQNESKSNNANLLTGSLQSLPVTSQQTSTSSAPNPPSLPEQAPIRPISTSVSNDFNSQLASNSAQATMSQQNIPMAGKPISSFGLVGKQKKNRKSPCPGEYDEGGVSGNNITSRDDVQSPAYSDISDDSTPIQDADALEKSQSAKHIDLLKKPPEIEMPGSGGNISAGQHSLPPSLGGYNMYQFFQQQQFIVQPSAEQQQLSKPTIPTGIVQPSNQISTQQSSQHSQSQLSNAHNLQQQQTSNHMDYSNKTKDPPLDLITKNTANQQQPHQLQDSNKSQDLTMPPQTTSNNLSNPGPVPTCGNLSANLNSLTSLGPSAVPQPTPSKSISHFYPFNYIPSGYPYSVDSNYGPVSIVSSEDSSKLGGHAGAQSPVEQGSQQQIPAAMIKEERTKESHSPQETLKPPPHINPNKMIKSEPITKQEPNKMDSSPNVNVVTSQQVPQQPLALHPKDMQTYTSIYQRHPISLAPQQLSREEELRRYYVFSDQQRRQNNAMQSLNVNNQQLANVQSVHHKEEANAPQQQISMPHPQQQLKLKQNNSNVGNASVNKVTNLSKDSPKQKPDEEIKINKQEGQKPTMETQGPPPPPTSQYFLHPSYIAPTPFGFDPNHPMYRNVLMSAAPYNTQPYHLPIPRYHAPEDLSRNTTTKALDALHHAASFYTTHKIHELSERALKSPNSGGNNSNNNNPGAVKVSVSSPNIGPPQQNNSGSNIVPHHSNTNQSNNSGLLNMPTHNAHGGAANKQQDVLGHKQHGPSGPIGPGAQLNETQKQQSANSSNVPGNGPGSGNNPAGANASDSRSPPPQRHVHTHHHTHVGLGYPMYPAPYGAAVLASQQAAAVAVINPFPPAPTK